MCELVKQCMRERVNDMDQQFLQTGENMNMIHEVSKTFVKVILVCGLGVDLSDEKLTYYERGVKTEKSLNFVLREVFHGSRDRWPGF